MIKKNKNKYLQNLQLLSHYVGKLRTKRYYVKISVLQIVKNIILEPLVTRGTRLAVYLEKDAANEYIQLDF